MPSEATRVLGPARDHNCALCGRPAQSWQHRVSRSRGGPTDGFNCVPLCGSGTTGCHGWAEEHPYDAQEVRVDIAGSFLRGRYIGPDDTYRKRYP